MKAIRFAILVTVVSFLVGTGNVNAQGNQDGEDGDFTQIISITPSSPVVVGTQITVNVAFRTGTFGRVCFANLNNCAETQKPADNRANKGRGKGKGEGEDNKGFQQALVPNFTAKFQTNGMQPGTFPITIQEAGPGKGNARFNRPFISVIFIQLILPAAPTAVVQPPLVVTATMMPPTATSVVILPNFDRNVPFQPGLPSLSQAIQPNVPGGVNVSVFCQAMGKGVPTHAQDGTPNAAFSWLCPPDLPLGDFMQVCFDVFGPNFQAIDVLGPNSLNGWRCVQTVVSVVPFPVQVNPNPVVNPCSTLPARVMVGGFANNATQGEIAVRNLPNTQSFEVTPVGSGQPMSVVGGPVCDEGMTWWLIAYNGFVGWTPETMNGQYQIAPQGNQ